MITIVVVAATATRSFVLSIIMITLSIAYAAPQTRPATIDKDRFPRCNLGKSQSRTCRKQ